MLQNSTLAKNFSDKFSSSNFGQNSIQKQQILIYQSIMDYELGFYSI
jgi:hypothetical protein